MTKESRQAQKPSSFLSPSVVQFRHLFVWIVDVNMELSCPDCPSYPINSLYDYTQHRNLYHDGHVVCFMKQCSRSGFTNIRQHMYEVHPVEGVSLTEKRRRNHSPEMTISSSSLDIVSSHDPDMNVHEIMSVEEDGGNDDDYLDLDHDQDPITDSRHPDNIVTSLFSQIMEKKEDKLVNDVQFISLVTTLLRGVQKVMGLEHGKDREYILEQLLEKVNSPWSIRTFIKAEFSLVEAESHYTSGSECCRIPIKAIITRKLMDQDIATTLLNANSYDPPSDGSISSFRDSSSFKQDCKSLFSKYQGRDDVLIIFGELYADDFSLANPVGPFTGSSTVTGVYMNFLDIKKKDRSRREDQSLISIIPSEDCGLNHAYSKIKKELISLESEGFRMVVLGKEYLVVFVMCKVCGDNKSIFELLGKVVCFRSGSICRVCTATHDEIQINPFSGSIRDRYSWEQDVQSFMAGGNVEGLREPPVFYGMNYFSCWNMYPQDRLHTLLLGVYPDFIELMLQDVITQSNLSQFNHSIAKLSFKNGNPEVRIISGGRNTRSLKGSGSQIYDIFLNLPEIFISFIFDSLDMVTEQQQEQWRRIRSSEKYQTYLTLRRFDCLIRQASFTRNDLVTIHLLVKSFFHQRNHLARNQAITPKLHYMTHWVHEIMTHGPVMNYDNLVYERRHSSFVRKINTIKCRKNLSRILVDWDCRVSAIRRERRDKVRFLGSEKKLSADDLFRTGLKHSPSLFHVIGIRIDNCEFKVGQIRKWQDGFVQIKFIVSSAEKEFDIFCEKYEISSFNTDLHSYQVTLAGNGLICIKLSSLPRLNTSMRKFVFCRDLFINKVDSL